MFKKEPKKMKWEDMLWYFSLFLAAIIITVTFLNLMFYVFSVGMVICLAALLLGLWDRRFNNAQHSRVLRYSTIILVVCIIGSFFTYHLGYKLYNSDLFQKIMLTYQGATEIGQIEQYARNSLLDIYFRIIAMAWNGFQEPLVTITNQTS